MYIRIQTNISKNGMPYLISALEIDESTSNQQRCFEVPPFNVVGALVNGARLLIPEDGYRSCPYKVKRRSGFQIVQADLSK